MMTFVSCAAWACAASALSFYDLHQIACAQSVVSKTSPLDALPSDIARNLDVYDLSFRGRERTDRTGWASDPFQQRSGGREAK